MGQTYHAIWVHLIWSTKYRQPLIVQELKFKLYDKFREIAKVKDYHLDFVNGVEDHVHLLMGIKPKFAIAEVVKNLKGISYDWVHDNALSDEHFHWQDGYAALSVSPDRVPTVRGYIKKQEAHHRKVSFEGEWDLFKKHAIHLDEK
ncbi:MAG: IS200/IS605 family transposase [Bacteroidetes bacterium]|nr:IS200/IS605 family transposase [Bacteroidota bacterium]